jgi:3-oxoacyl-[acyl-carrier protein] reductase
MDKVAQKVVAITGAGQGIGLATAQRFALAGHLLALNYVRDSQREALEQINRLALENGGEMLAIKADISRHEEAEGFIAEAEHHFGRIDVLVNNAGIIKTGPTHLVEWSDWEAILSTNLNGTWACLRAALPGMLKRRSGRIVNISSEQGLIGYPQYAAYCASKGAIIALTKAVAKEVASQGVLVNSVAPGPVETDMLIYSSTEYNDETRMQVPLQRFGQPDEIAATIEFLAGPGGAFFVGQIISPNGGTAI